ncbi:MAG TPA: 4Fe-4S dicluster domain-containing protein [Vicinamibacteria bacterium]|nr:4Fe-4S dicluster domain-containing protein [Vicinamibacteria bacterium]
MSDLLVENGVVGAGGAGFPTAVKLQSRVGTLIVNGAECEPLLHKDKELLRHLARPMLAGLRLAMDRASASEAVIGIKHKYAEVIESITPLLPSGARVRALSDSYPAGDEFVLVHDVTGRVIPPGGLPRDVGVTVLNVETLVNVGLERPVTHKYLTVAGAVASPVTLRVPVGTAIREVIDAAGGATVSEPAVLLGGVMMARLAASLDEPVTKTTGGVVVLPSSHRLARRHAGTPAAAARIGRSACDQCRFCTELCPRYLLGHPIEPHRAMLALGFTAPRDRLLAGTLNCCECNLCTLYACPEDLDPRQACVDAKAAARARQLVWKGRPDELRPHPLADSRRVPMRRLMLKLGLDHFRNVGPLEDRPLLPRRVVLPLKQHAGAPALPVVRAGERVRVGDVVAAPDEGALGARLHASIEGRVQAVDGAVVIEAGGRP